MGLRLELLLLPLESESEDKLLRRVPRLSRLRREDVGDLEYSRPLLGTHPGCPLSLGERLRRLAVLGSRRRRLGEVDRDLERPREERRE